MLYLPIKWESTFTQHVHDTIKLHQVTPSQNLVLSFQGECTTRENVPICIEVKQTFYKLAGTIKGDTVHAVAVLPIKDGKF